MRESASCRTRISSHVHLRGEIAITCSQGIHLDSVGILLLDHLVILVGIRIQHKRGNSERDCVLHKLIDVVLASLRILWNWPIGLDLQGIINNSFPGRGIREN